MRIDYFKMKLWRLTYNVRYGISFKEYYHWGGYERKEKDKVEAPLPDPKWDKAMAMLDSLPKWKGVK